MNQMGVRISIVVALLAGAARGEAPDGGAHVTTTLTATNPAQDFPLPATTSAATRVHLAVLRIDNPSHQGVTIHVELRAGESRLSPIGTVTLYPSDRPASFDLRLPPDAKKHLQTQDPQTRALNLHIKLISPATGRKLVEPLSVVIGPLDWR
jgi:hypothetical protein